MSKKEETHLNGWIHTMGIVMTGGILALSICFVFMVFCSVLISNGILSERAMLQYTAIACLIGSFCGAMYSVCRTHGKTLIIGLLTAGIQFLLVLMIGLLLYSSISLSGSGSVIVACCFAGGALAGFLGANKKKKRRK